MAPDTVGGNRAAQAHHGILRMLRQMLLDRFDRGFRIGVLQVLEAGLGRFSGHARGACLCGAAARACGDDIDAAQTRGAFDQAAGAARMIACRKRLPQRQRVAIAAEVVQQRGEPAPVFG